MVLRSIGVLSAGKIMAALYGAIGLLYGGMILLFTIFVSALPQQQNGPNAQAWPIFMGIVMAVLMPVMSAIGGFIGGIIMAAVYNLVAGMLGGLELEIETRQYAA